jgi:hypothetical protein
VAAENGAQIRHWMDAKYSKAALDNRSGLLSIALNNDLFGQLLHGRVTALHLTD